MSRNLNINAGVNINLFPRTNSTLFPCKHNKPPAVRVCLHFLTNPDKHTLSCGVGGREKGERRRQNRSTDRTGKESDKIQHIASNYMLSTIHPSIHICKRASLACQSMIKYKLHTHPSLIYLLQHTQSTHSKSTTGMQTVFINCSTPQRYLPMRTTPCY